MEGPATRTHCPGSKDGHSFIAVHGGDHMIYMCGNADCTWRETKEFSRSRWR